jgi:hypothetical protein
MKRFNPNFSGGLKSVIDLDLPLDREEVKHGWCRRSGRRSRSSGRLGQARLGPGTGQQAPEPPVAGRPDSMSPL